MPARVSSQPVKSTVMLVALILTCGLQLCEAKNLVEEMTALNRSNNATHGVTNVSNKSHGNHTIDNKIRVKNFTEDIFAVCNATNDGNMEAANSRENISVVIADDTNTVNIIEHLATEDVIAKEKTKDQVSPDEISTEQAIPGDNITEQAIPEDNITEEPILEGNITEEPILEGNITEMPILEGNIAEEAIHEEKIIEEAIPDDKMTEQVIPEDNITEQAIQEGDITEQAISEGNNTEEAIPEGNITEEAIHEDKIIEAITKHITVQDTEEGNITEEEIHAEEMTEQAIEKGNITGQAIPQDNITEHSIPQGNVITHVTLEGYSTGQPIPGEKTFDDVMTQSNITVHNITDYSTKEINMHNELTAMISPRGRKWIRESTIPTPDSELVYRFNLNATNRFLATDATKFLCGSKQLCNQTSPKEFGHSCARCYPCQCDEMCHFYGDCCPDLLYNDSSDIPSVTFPYLSCTKEYWTLWGNHLNIFMVNSCPNNADPILTEKCERPDNNYQDQATPVSVLNSQITYRNIFCAQCHHMPDVQVWRHHVACQTDAVLNTATSKADLWCRVLADKGCKIKSYPPDGVTPRQCFHSQLATCRPGSNPVIENLCLSFENIVEFYSTYTKYRNIFCAVCNGEAMDKGRLCSKHINMHTPLLPCSLDVLLDFNPSPKQRASSEGKIRMCERNRIYDPFSATCRNITCSEERNLSDGACTVIPSYNQSIGFLLDVTLVSANSSVNSSRISSLIDQYTSMLHKQLTIFHPVLLTHLDISLYTANDRVDDGPQQAVLVNIKGRILVLNQENISLQEKAVKKIISKDFSYNHSGEIITFLSRPRLCEHQINYPAGKRVPWRETQEEFFRDEFVDGQNVLRMNQPKYTTIHMNCPFVEYPDRFEEPFTFDPLTQTLEFQNCSFLLSFDEFSTCGKVLRICIQTINNITKVIFSDEAMAFREERNFILPIVSLICISLSLVGLFLTFLVYCLVPKLRTLPGKNSMALMFHLFCSHLLFLTTSNRTTNVVLCQVFGVLLHYFWMATFTWMLVCAYHMYTVFTRIRSYTSRGNRDAKRLVIYSVFSIVIPAMTITCCIITHSVQSHGRGIGYGGNRCFLNNPMAIGVFFVGPLSLILVMNAVFFAKTILAIRSVPDMKEASNKSKKKHIFVYIKLSLLFGFTWVFGILAVVVQSTALQYIFTVLTGSQGVMIFVAYCVNAHTWALLKASISGNVTKTTSKSADRSKSDKGVSTMLTETLTKL